ncbi:helix-turn-helix domain-containing protein [Aurantimonas marianensis]|uniref:Helix-turn-helix domain-containing protein n=1 Tax=Aurantimonas marianensis TaxID=2920428 RepID=A0A9X2KGU6_9HYPH|nr:helix-turn-helix domain-containing protein [Aurantimonas marianensis]MCP3056725.1 helix-turn-helix domain-containing protein [Aurantimonas marianensis]
MIADLVSPAADALPPLDIIAGASVDRSAIYRALLGEIADTIVAGPESFAQVETQRLGPLVLYECRLHDMSHERHAPSSNANGSVFLQLAVSGTLRVELPDRPIEIREGEIALFNTGRPLRMSADRIHLMTVRLTPAFIEAAAPWAGDPHGTVIDAARAGLLAAVMVALMRHAHAIPAAGAAGAVRAFGELLAIALQAPTAAFDGDAPGGKKLARARALVEAKLTVKHLSPTMIAAESGLSRSVLYELFKPLGGVSHYVQARRAARLHALLSNPGDARSIAELAFEAGFASDSHASRTFRDLFGVSPGRFRRDLFLVAGQA